MFEALDRQTKLTANQWKIISAAIIGNMLDFFDYFLIGFVLAFIIGPWNLTYGQSAMVLLSSGVGAVAGGFFWGYFADRFGRRPAFIATVLCFSFATGALALTPDQGWIYLVIFRFFVGFGGGGLYSIDIPLVQEFVPTSKRGFIVGLITSFISLGVLAGALSAGFLTSMIGWRGLFAIGLAPALLTLLVRVWVPESPRWLLKRGRPEEARRSLAWALQVAPETLPLEAPKAESKPSFWEIFNYPRSLLTSWIIQLGGQTGSYGVVLWAPTLLVLILKVSPAQASTMWILIGITGFAGRLAFSFSSSWLSRKAAGAIFGFGSAIVLTIAAFNYDAVLGGVSVFYLMLVIWAFFGDGGFAVSGPYAAEVWPTRVRATGMGSAYGFGGIGKIIGPLGLALIIGSSNIVKPDVSLGAITPAFLYFAAFYALAGLAFVVMGLETKGRSLESIDAELTSSGKGA